MTTLDAFGRAYLRLTLHINKHIDGYIDAYTGPEELKAQVEGEAKRSPEELLADLQSLREMIPEGDRQRETYLRAVLRAMDCTVRMLNGETFDFLDEVERLFDIRPTRIDEAEFSTTHEALDAALPGNSGDLVERLASFKAQYELPREHLMEVLEQARLATRERTVELVELVNGETVTLVLTEDQPWAAYNWYLGEGRSLIEFNTDLAVSALDVLRFLAHEGYPGHHTESQLKERYLYKEKGYAEYAATLMHSPSMVTAEGIATTALDIIFPGEEKYQWVVDEMVGKLGLPKPSITQLEVVEEARNMFSYVTGNAAILYHRGQLDDAALIPYIQKHALVTETRAQQAVRFISDPLFRAYIFTYTQGRDLIEAAAENGDKLSLFKRLLTEAVLPSEIKEMGQSTHDPD